MSRMLKWTQNCHVGPTWTSGPIRPKFGDKTGLEFWAQDADPKKGMGSPRNWAKG